MTFSAGSRRPTEAALPTDRQTKRRAEAIARSAPTADPNPDWTLFLFIPHHIWLAERPAPHSFPCCTTLTLRTDGRLPATATFRTSPPTSTSVLAFIFWCLWFFGFLPLYLISISACNICTSSIFLIPAHILHTYPQTRTDIDALSGLAVKRT
ncbi:hypothetical protein B0H14DRAFT_2863516 [Mycena olivaceomarginata]|nr:hypothetical protein B0H14DRAFT_2863516 [Mycena olivaceomarginata]